MRESWQRYEISVRIEPYRFPSDASMGSESNASIMGGNSPMYFKLKLPTLRAASTVVYSITR